MPLCYEGKKPTPNGFKSVIHGSVTVQCSEYVGQAAHSRADARPII
jgi:hypothetical protein